MIHLRPSFGHNLSDAASAAVAQPQFDASALSTPAAGDVLTRTISVTVGAALTKPALFVAVQSILVANVSSVVSSVDGAFTLHDTKANGTAGSVELWKLVNPTAGAHTITVTVPVARHFLASALSMYQVDQTTPLGTAAKASGTGQTATVAIITAASDVILDVVAKVSSTEAMTPDAPQASVQNNATTDATAANNVRGGCSYKPASTGPDSTIWTWSTTDRAWAMMAVAVKYAA